MPLKGVLTRLKGKPQGGQSASPAVISDPSFDPNKQPLNTVSSPPSQNKSPLHRSLSSSDLNRVTPHSTATTADPPSLILRTGNVIDELHTSLRSGSTAISPIHSAAQAISNASGPGLASRNYPSWSQSSAASGDTRVFSPARRTPQMSAPPRPFRDPIGGARTTDPLRATHDDVMTPRTAQLCTSLPDHTGPLRRRGSDSDLQLRPVPQKVHGVGASALAGVQVVREGMLFHRIPKPLGRTSVRQRPWRRRWCVLSRVPDPSRHGAYTHTFSYHEVADGGDSLGVRSEGRRDGPLGDCLGTLLITPRAHVEDGTLPDPGQSVGRDYSFVLRAEEKFSDGSGSDVVELALDVSLIELELAAVTAADAREWTDALRSEHTMVQEKKSGLLPQQGFFQRRRRGNPSSVARRVNYRPTPRELAQMAVSARVTNESNTMTAPETQFSFFDGDDVNADNVNADNNDRASSYASSMTTDTFSTIVLQHVETGTVSLVEVPIAKPVDNTPPIKAVDDGQRVSRRESILVKAVADELRVSRKESILVTRGGSAASLSSDEPPKKSERDNIVDEIIATEVAYNTHLKLCLKLYEVPLRFAVGGSTQLLAEADIDLIFGGVETIHNYSVALLSRLKELASAADWDSGQGMFAVCFVEMAPFFRSYFDYAQKFQAATKRLKELRGSSSEFAAFYDTRKQVAAAAQLDLMDLLITPIQRLPRYGLLLADLLKHTPEGHPDRPSTEKALEQMRQNARDMNEAMGDADEKEKLGDLAQRNAEDSFFVVMSASRKFHRRGTARAAIAPSSLGARTGGIGLARKLGSPNVGRSNPPFDCYAFLFSDSVLLSRASNNQLVDKVGLESAQLRELSSTGTRDIVIESPRLAYTLSFKTPEEATMWHDAILLAQQEMWQARLAGLSDRLLSRG